MAVTVRRTVTVGAVVNADPRITSGGGGDNATATTRENTTLVSLLTATDPDVNQTLTFAITGDEYAGLCELRKTAPAFESLPAAGATPGYQVVVQVSDGQGGSDPQSLTITVENADEAATISGTSTGTVTEDGTTITSDQIGVADPDAGQSHGQLRDVLI
jgi:VCBS repeat-containing protein